MITNKYYAKMVLFFLFCSSKYYICCTDIENRTICYDAAFTIT